MVMAFCQPSNDVFLYLLVLFVISKPIFTHDYHWKDRCPPPMSIKYGMYKPIKEKYKFGDFVKYSCNYSSSYLFGDDDLECGENGNWQGTVASCAFPEEITRVNHDHHDKKQLFDRNDVSCATSGIKQSWHISTKECVSGFVLIKVVFRALSKEESIVNVLLSVNVEGGHCTNVQQQFTKDYYRAYIYQCNVREKTCQFEIVPTTTYRHQIELCEIYIYRRKSHSCSLDITIPNGIVLSPRGVTKIRYGESILISCDDGFRLQGNSHIYCSDGIFVYEKPPCNPIHCNNNPPIVTNGRWSEWNQSKPYFYGSRLVPTCSNGYAFSGGINFTKCQKDGSWSGANITCLKEETITSWVIPIVASAMGVVILMIVLVFAFILCSRRRNSEKQKVRQAEEIYSEPSYCISEQNVQAQTLPPLPPLNTHPLYSDPAEMYYSIDEEKCYHEPYNSGNENQIILSQNRNKINPVYAITEKSTINKRKSFDENITSKEISIENELYNSG